VGTEPPQGWAIGKLEQTHEKARDRCKTARSEWIGSLLQLTKQQQNQQNHDDQAEAAAAVVTGAVEWAAANAAEAAQQCNDQND
jgi:hypothetical protein